MQLRWTEEAARDFKRIADYLFERAPERAEDVDRRIYEAPVMLLRSPYLGRTGRIEGTREFVLTPLPYILIYRGGCGCSPYSPYPSRGAEVAIKFCCIVQSIH